MRIRFFAAGLAALATALIILPLVDAARPMCLVSTGISVRLLLSSFFWEMLEKLVACALAFREVIKGSFRLLRHSAVIAAVRWRILRSLTLHGGIALTTLLLLVNTVTVVFGGGSPV